MERNYLAYLILVLLFILSVSTSGEETAHTEYDGGHNDDWDLEINDFFGEENTEDDGLVMI